MVFMRTRLARRHPRDEQGAIAVLTAFVMVGLMICAAIVVDLGNARDVRRQSQNASDAAALAGANVLFLPGACSAKPCLDAAVAEVKSYARKNFQVEDVDWTNDCKASATQALTNVASSGTNCISFNSGATLVRVYMPTRTLTTFFGQFAGKSSIPVGSSAQARVKEAVKCSLCFLGSVDPINGDLTVSGGSIAVNMNVKAGSESYWNAKSIGVAGTVSGSNFTPAVTAIDHFVDPLAASLNLPWTTANLPELSTLSAKTDPCSTTDTGGPGLYGSFELPNSLCTLKPGLYVISGTWDMKNNAKLVGPGVTLYVKSPGYLDFKNGNVDITPPSTAPLTGVPAGFAIIYDKNNTNSLYLQGNGDTSIKGIVYAPASSLIFNGNSCFGFRGGPIVLNNALTNGNKSCIKVSDAVETTVIPEKIHLNQ